MPEPRERIARALSGLQGHPPDIRFEGKPMWQSFLPEADAALAAADTAPLIALLRQIEAHAAVPETLRDQAAAVLRGYAAGRRTFRPQGQDAPSPDERSGAQTCDDRSWLPNRQPPFSCGTSRLPPEPAVHRTGDAGGRVPEPDQDDIDCPCAGCAPTTVVIRIAPQDGPAHQRAAAWGCHRTAARPVEA